MLGDVVLVQPILEWPWTEVECGHWSPMGPATASLRGGEKSESYCWPETLYAKPSSRVIVSAAA